VQVEVAGEHRVVPEARLDAGHQYHVRSHRFAVEIESDQEVVRTERKPDMQTYASEGGSGERDQRNRENRDDTH